SSRRRAWESTTWRRRSRPKMGSWPNSWRSTSRQKKRLGNSDRSLGSARYAGPDRGFRPALVGEDRDRRRAVHRVARHHSQQVLRLAGTLRPSERAQRLGYPPFLGGGLGGGG